MGILKEGTKLVKPTKRFLKDFFTSEDLAKTDGINKNIDETIKKTNLQKQLGSTENQKNIDSDIIKDEAEIAQKKLFRTEMKDRSEDTLANPEAREANRQRLYQESALKKANLPKTTKDIQNVADGYSKQNNMNVVHNVEMTDVDPKYGAKIAKAYTQMKHDPNNPEVKEAYQALIDETAAQYKYIVDNGGMKFSRIAPDMENPYKNSKDLFKDIEKGHMWYYPTDSGFGSGDKFKDHPLLQEVKVNGQTMKANDLFRIVHDFFGHAKEGYSFGPKGEESAWLQHAQMYSPKARRALTTETRGQNSWVNFGPYGKQNRADPSKTRYADQKAGLLPEEFTVPRPDRVPQAPSARSVGLGPKAFASGVGLGVASTIGDEPEVRTKPKETEPVVEESDKKPIDTQTKTKTKKTLKAIGVPDEDPLAGSAEGEELAAQLDETRETLLTLNDPPMTPSEQRALAYKELKKARQARVNTLEWAKVFEKLVAAVTKYGAAREGLDRGLDMSRAEIERTDWDSMINQAFETYKLDLNDLTSGYDKEDKAKSDVDDKKVKLKTQRDRLNLSLKRLKDQRARDIKAEERRRKDRLETSRQKQLDRESRERTSSLKSKDSAESKDTNIPATAVLDRMIAEKANRKEIDAFIEKNYRNIPEDYLRNIEPHDPWGPTNTYKKKEGTAQPSSTDSKGPEVGQIEDGHKFLGGNPTDPKNWEKI